jgi:hypothetical protein
MMKMQASASIWHVAARAHRHGRPTTAPPRAAPVVSSTVTPRAPGGARRRASSRSAAGRRAGGGSERLDLGGGLGQQAHLVRHVQVVDRRRQHREALGDLLFDRGTILHRRQPAHDRRGTTLLELVFAAGRGRGLTGSSSNASAAPVAVPWTCSRSQAGDQRVTFCWRSASATGGDSRVQRRQVVPSRAQRRRVRRGVGRRLVQQALQVAQAPVAGGLRFFMRAGCTANGPGGA